MPAFTKNRPKARAGGALGRLHLKDCSYTYKGKKYRNYAIAESYQENGKSQKKILKYLNDLTEAEVQSYKNMLQALNEGSAGYCNLEQLEFSTQKDYLNVAVLLDMWDQLGFSHVFKSPPDQKKMSTEQVAMILTLARLLKPSSSFQTIAWFKKTMLPELLGLEAAHYNMMRIFRELSCIHRRKESIEDHLFKKANPLVKGGSQIYFVDGTTTFFEGRKCALAAPGKDKSHGFKSHTLLILLMTDRKGYPCAWDVLQGSSSELKGFQKLAERLKKRIQISDMTFCFDRGFTSEKNFSDIQDMKCHFISGLDQDQISSVFDGQKFASLTRDKLLNCFQERGEEKQKTRSPVRRVPFALDGFHTADKKKFYKDLGKIKKYRYVVGFNVEIFTAQRASREETLAEILLTIDKLNQEQLAAKKDREAEPLAKKVERLLDDRKANRLITYLIKPVVLYKRSQPIQVYQIEAQVNLVEKELTSQLDGVFVYITDHVKTKLDHSFELTAHEIVSHYKNKNCIEENFKDMKQFLELRPIHARLEKHVSGVIALIILAQFINIYIKNSLKNGAIEMSIQEFYRALNDSSPVAFLQAPGQNFQKLINIDLQLKEVLKTLSKKDFFTLRLYNRP